MARWTIARLSSFKGDRRSFVSGDEALDRFFHQLAGQYERRRIGITWIATLEGEERVAGYYTSAASSVPFESVPINVGRHPVPTILIARLAVHVAFRKRRLGELLLFHAIRTAVAIAKETAVWAVTVDAYESALPFYTRYGFRPFLDPHHAATPSHALFLPIREAEKLPFE